MWTRFAIFSDIHNRPDHWQYIMRKSAKFSGGILLAGDYLEERDKQPMDKQRAAAIKRLTYMPLAERAICAAVTGNHDIEQGFKSGPGDYYWLSNLAARTPLLRGHGMHQLRCGWVIDCIDWMEESSNWPVSCGPNTITLSHLGPKCDATITKHGVDFSSEYLTSQAEDGSGSTVYVCGHVHDSRRHLARVGGPKGSLVCNPGQAKGAIPNYIILDLAENTAVFHSAELPKERIAHLRLTRPNILELPYLSCSMQNKDRVITTGALKRQLGLV
jgi:hypothetical protein